MRNIQENRKELQFCGTYQLLVPVGDASLLGENIKCHRDNLSNVCIA
jgi:hypothetical protein